MGLLRYSLRESSRRVPSKRILRASNPGTIWCCTWLSVPSFSQLHSIRCGQRSEVASSVTREAIEGVSGARNKRAALLGGNLDANQRALQRNVGAIPIDIWIVRGQALLGASQRIFGALQVDLFRALGGLRKHRDAVRQNFGKSANDGDMHGFPAAHVVIAEFTDPQFRNERRVPG